MLLAFATISLVHGFHQKPTPIPPGPCFTVLSVQKDIDSFEDRLKNATASKTLAAFSKPFIDVFNQQHLARQQYNPTKLYGGEKQNLLLSPVVSTPLLDGFTIKVTYHNWGSFQDADTATRYYKTTDHSKSVRATSIPLYPEKLLERYSWAEVQIMLDDPKFTFKIVDDTKTKPSGAK